VRLATPAVFARSLLPLCAAISSFVFAPAAEANLLPPAVRTLPITSPLVGGGSVGDTTLTVTYTDTRATALAAAPAVKLGPGNDFRLELCVKAHSLRAAFDTKCAEKPVDTHGVPTPITVAAPTVTVGLDRPARGGSAYFSYVTVIKWRQPDGSFKEAGSSWPTGGLGKAYVGVPAVGTTTSQVPASEGMLLSNRKTGGMNTGQPDSMCMARSAGDPGASEGLSLDGLGPDAPAYYEVGEPTGPYAGKPPVGVMLLIHGGGWSATGAGAAATMHSDADRWRERGWRTLNITYAACAASFDDVRWFYDRARATWGEGMPYCAIGASAGGNLAVMLAHARPSLACAIDQGGPTDGVALAKQSTPVGGTDGPRWAYNQLVAAVSPENVHWWSPARFPIPNRGISARVLFALAEKDPFVPWAQGTALRDKMVAADPQAYVDLQRLPGGETQWVHAKVSQTALAAYYEREEALVAPLVAP
jgi:acetyl esterase/lipase